MEIKQLRYFLRVADTGSVSRAAAALAVAQPAVSRQIAALEEALGAPLFFRNGRGVTLTEAGEQLYSHATLILDAVRAAEHTVHDTLGVPRGTVVIGATPAVMRYLAPKLIQATAGVYPELSLVFTEGYSGHINEWLSNGALDIALLHDATRTQHFLTEPLVREDLAFVSWLPGDSDIPLASALSQPLILPREAHGLRLVVERAAASIRHQVEVAAELDSLAATLALVEAKFAPAILPIGAVKHQADTLSVARIGEPKLERTLLLATSSQRPVNQATRTVISEIKIAVRQLTDGAVWPGTRVATPQTRPAKLLVSPPADCRSPLAEHAVCADLPASKLAL